MRMRTSPHAIPMLRINCPVFQPLAPPQTDPFPPPLYTCEHFLAMTSTCPILPLLGTHTMLIGSFDDYFLALINNYKVDEYFKQDKEKCPRKINLQ
jgi:hypothetical protein